MKKNITLILFVVLISLLFVSCDRIRYDFARTPENKENQPKYDYVVNPQNPTRDFEKK